MLKIKNRFFSSVLILVLLVSGFVFGVGFERARATEELETKLEVFLQVLDVLRNDYVDKNLNYSKMVYGAIRGMLKELDDPYTRFMEPTSYKEMQIRMRGSYSGIGIYIGMKNDHLAVISPIAGTPADQAGLKSGDLIVTIDGKSTNDMSLEEAVTLIRGKRGTKVALGILRGKAKEAKEYKILRDKIEIKSVETKKLTDKDILYIRLNTFEDQRASVNMRKALADAKRKKIKGIIIDVRNNGGGLLQNAIEIGSMFIKEGPIVSTVDREGNKESLNASGGVIWEKPVVVLINGASASASEILAGALQDTSRAKLVGEKSFGKASVQSVRTLNDESALLVTIAKYLTPSGKDISKKGILPDFVVVVPTQEANGEEVAWFTLGDESKDIQLKKAMQVLKEAINKE